MHPSIDQIIANVNLFLKATLPTWDTDYREKRIGKEEYEEFLAARLDYFQSFLDIAASINHKLMQERLATAITACLTRLGKVSI